MKLKLFFVFLVISALSLQAQDARSIMDKASETYQKAGGVTANFSVDAEDTKNKVTYSQDGKAYMKGERFMIDVPDGITWFDGTTQWVYVKDTNEVSVSTPSGNELQAISPLAMFNIYKTGFDLKNLGPQIVDGIKVIEIEMTPNASTKKATDIQKINILIDIKTNIFTRIAITDKTNFLNIVSISNIKTGVSFTERTFQFDKEKYKTAEVVDLR